MEIVVKQNMEDIMKKREEMELVRIEKTRMDKKGTRAVRVYQRKPKPPLSREVLKWTIVVTTSIAIGVRWGMFM